MAGRRDGGVDVRVVLQRDGYQALRRFCERYGANFTTFLDALGEIALEREEDAGDQLPLDEAGPLLHRAILRAQELGEQRRKRGV